MKRQAEINKHNKEKETEDVEEIGDENLEKEAVMMKIAFLMGNPTSLMVKILVQFSYKVASS